MTDVQIRLSRPCYDKYHRCPGWAGGGWKYGKRKRCENGYVLIDYDKPLWRWRFHRCNTCEVIVLPYRVRWVEPTNWAMHIRHLIYKYQTNRTGEHDG